MDKDLPLFSALQGMPEEDTAEKWYTIDELAELCGYKSMHSIQSNPNILEVLNRFSNSKDVKMGGYHNSQKFYSENVLKALKQYQLRNSAPNAVENKEAVITGNVSFVAHEAQEQTISAIINNPKLLLEFAMQSSVKILEVTKELQELQVTNNLLMHTDKTYTATEIAKEMGMRSAHELNLKLKDAGVIYKCNGTWVPTANYADMGYYEIKQQVLDSGHVVYQGLITQNGREFILKLFA